MELVARENFGPDGESGRQEATAEERRRLQEEADARWLILTVSLMLILQLLVFMHFVCVLVDILVMVISGKSTLHLSTTMRVLHLLAALLPPATTMLVFYMYNTLEQQAFESFEEMFPPDEDGMGDARRIMSSAGGRSSIFWARNRGWRFSNSRFWLFALQLPFLLVVLHDLNMGLGYLGYLYSTTEWRGVKFAFILLVALVNYKYRFFPAAFIVTLIADFYGQILPFTQLRPQHVTPTFLCRLVLGVLIICWWRFRLRNLPRPFIPDLNTTLRLILGQITDDVDMLLLGQLALLARWMRLTGQAQRRIRRADNNGEDDDDAVQIALIIPGAIQNQLAN